MGQERHRDGEHHPGTQPSRMACVKRDRTATAAMGVFNEGIHQETDV
jgi:hypothetical protein